MTMHRCILVYCVTLASVCVGSGQESSSDVTHPHRDVTHSRRDLTHSHNNNNNHSCERLQPGQFYCDDPDIDPTTQQPQGCTRENPSVLVPCYPVDGLVCNGEEHDGKSVGFYQQVACKWTEGKSFNTALLLSVFLGMFGVDRFYLGYPAVGMLKLCTLGFMFLGQLVDVLWIALQVVGPSDGSDYVIDPYGALMEQRLLNNDTIYK